MKLAQGSVWLAVGDSITDAGRRRPVGEGPGLGGGYVALAASLLDAAYPERRIRVLNTGIGGNTVRDLESRWKSDVVDLSPSWLSIMIGTNDVWRQFDSADKFAAVMPAEFERIYTDLLYHVPPSVERTVLMTPFYVQPSRSDAMRARMDEYGEIVANLAAKFDCLFVDTQTAFDEVCQNAEPLSLAGDRVHPTLTGSAVLARALLKALDFQF